MESLRKYILYFLVGIAICLVGASGVFADTLTETFTSFNTTAESFSSSIQCNNEICVVYGVTQYNYQMDFEWGSVSTKTCSNSATITGKLSLSKTNMGINNNDFLWNNVYIVNNNTRNNCNWQVGTTDTSFTCVVDTLYPNFKLGYTLSSMGGQYTYDSIIYRSFDISCDTSTSQIIENNNTNTQSIINNNNQNTQAIIDSNKVCNPYDKSDIIDNGHYLSSDGGIYNSQYWGITDYIDINKSTLTILNPISANAYACFYNVNKTRLSCLNFSNLSGEISIPNNAFYVRASINNVSNLPTFEICKNGSQATSDAINGLDDTLNDDDTSGATSEASDFFSDFDTDTFGLTSIITAPLNLIQSLTSSTCNDLELPLPYLSNKKLILPCMTTIYSTYFGTFFTIYQTITYGIIAYWVCVRIFNLVKDFKNPEHDEIEVVDL